jgi:hypothetical protein
MKHLAPRPRQAVRFLAITLLLVSAAAPVRAQLTFAFSLGPAMTAFAGSDPVTAAMIGASMTAAAAKWSGSLFDPITIKITVDLDPTLPSSVFAAAFAAKVPTLYTSVSGALATDALSALDTTAVSSLQPGPHLEALTHDTSVITSPSPEIRLSGGPASDVWNTTLAVPRPNLKALGLLAPTDGAPGADGLLAINPAAFSLFDYTRIDGIMPGFFDFTGIAIHELGHLLGFSSGVDEIDFAGDGAPGNPTDLSDDAIFTVLDLYRYHPDSLAAPSQPGTGAVNDWRFGPGSPFATKPYFSVDAGATIIAAFATGAEHGDGDQASHFSSGVAAIMDPGFPPGILADPTTIDVAAMDAIGYDTVPEPSTALLLVSVLAFGVARRHRAGSILRKGG